MPHETDEPREAEPRRPKREYSAPAVSWEEPFDLTANLASACNKGPFDGGSCSASAQS